MIYLYGDKIGLAFEPVLRFKNLPYKSFIGGSFPLSLVLNDEDKVFYIGTKKAYDQIPSSIKKHTVFISKIGLDKTVIDATIASLSSHNLLFTKENIERINIDEIINHGSEVIEILVDSKRVRILPNGVESTEPEDGVLQVSLGSFLMTYQLLTKVDNVSKCVIKIHDK